MLTELAAEGHITPEEARQREKSLWATKRYLRGDFRNHVGFLSTSIDHCYFYSLADPDGKDEFNEYCGNLMENAHSHEAICDMCSFVDATLDDYQSLLTETQKTAADSKEEQKIRLAENRMDLFIEAKERIMEYKAHALRAQFAEDEKSWIIEGLLEGEAMILMDYSMKWIGYKARETQSGFFAKAGTSWHISYTIAKLPGTKDQLSSHSFVHIFSQSISQVIILSS